MLERELVLVRDLFDQAPGAPIAVLLDVTTEEVLIEAPVEEAEPTENPDTHRFECRSCGYVYDPAEGEDPEAYIRETAKYGVDVKHRDFRFAAAVLDLLLGLLNNLAGFALRISPAEMIKQLMDRGLVKIGGEEDTLGRPYLYVTTRLFLETFGLRKLDDLPNAEKLRQPPVEREAEPEEAA